MPALVAPPSLDAFVVTVTFQGSVNLLLRPYASAPENRRFVGELKNLGIRYAPPTISSPISATFSPAAISFSRRPWGRRDRVVSDLPQADRSARERSAPPPKLSYGRRVSRFSTSSGYATSSANLLYPVLYDLSEKVCLEKAPLVPEQAFFPLQGVLHLAVFLSYKALGAGPNQLEFASRIGGPVGALMLNVLTVDVEDYFQVEAFASRVSYDEWNHFTPRVERNLGRVLELFGRHGVRATFFVLGWVAQKFPRLVREIASAGHEVGCHGFAHQRVLRQTPAQFQADVQQARRSLMDEVQQPILCYRAPTFSIVKSTLWAFDVLAEEGFVFDSSVFPVHHDLYGIPTAPRFPCWYETERGNAIFEFPPSTVRRWHNNWPVAGGGYLRLMPYCLTRWSLKEINEREGQPAMVYFHPWELDPDQPRISAGWRSTWRHYTNLSRTEEKIDRLLRDFRFSTFSGTCQQLESYRESTRRPSFAESEKS